MIPPTMLTDGPLALLWSCWAAYWIIAAGRARPGERAEPRLSRIAHVAMVASSFILLFVEPVQVGLLGLAVLPAGAVSRVLGSCLAALGLAFATWARVYLGADWSGAVAIRSEQRLVQSGPYALVRNPIYSGLLLAFAGSAIVVAKLGAVLALAIAVFAYRRKMRIEESRLLAAFGGEYESYRCRVDALVPSRRAWISFAQGAVRSGERLLGLDELQRSIDRLYAAGEISLDRSQLLRRDLPRAVEESSYILRHLGAHLAIGVVFAFDIIPLPLGTIGRVLWVLGARTYESVAGTRERVRIHSLSVLLVAAIPWIGYCAYLLPLRARNPELTWILANHLSYRFYGSSFDEFLARKPRLIRSAGRRLFPSVNEEAASEQSSRPRHGG